MYGLEVSGDVIELLLMRLVQRSIPNLCQKEEKTLLRKLYNHRRVALLSVVFDVRLLTSFDSG